MDQTICLSHSDFSQLHDKAIGDFTHLDLSHQGSKVYLFSISESLENRLGKLGLQLFDETVDLRSFLLNFFIKLSLHPVLQVIDHFAMRQMRVFSLPWKVILYVEFLPQFDVPFDEYLQNAWMFECEVVIIDLFLSEKSEILWNSGGNGAMQRCFFEGF